MSIAAGHHSNSIMTRIARLYSLSSPIFLTQTASRIVSLFKGEGAILKPKHEEVDAEFERSSASSLVLHLIPSLIQQTVPYNPSQSWHKRSVPVCEMYWDRFGNVGRIILRQLSRLQLLAIPGPNRRLCASRNRGLALSSFQVQE